MMRKLVAHIGASVMAFGVAATLGAQPSNSGIAASEYVARRDALAASIDSGVIVAFGAREPVRHWPRFAQAHSFLYLTGYDEPDAALVIVKRGGTTTSALFAEPVNPLAEIFNGRRSTPAEVMQASGLATRPFDSLKPMLDSLAGRLPFYAVSDVFGAEFMGDDTLTYGRSFLTALKREHPSLQVASADGAVLRLRAKKSPAEQAIIRKAAEISAAGHKAGLCAIKPGASEYNVQALMEYVFRNSGADGPSYASIVGSGPNTTTLHYDRDDRTMNAGELVVMDVAAQYKNYAADVTRTAPISGTFTPEQRAVYQVVRDAQEAAARQLKPGAQARAMNDSANAALAAGLAKLGLIESPTASYDPPGGSERCQRFADACSQRSLYMPHGLGHGIGIEVHDPAQFYFGPTMQPGDAFTIEPGIYVRPNMLDGLPDTPKNRAMIAKLKPVIEKYKNIGVRIEDDYLITDRGADWLTHAPREVAEVESAMKSCTNRMTP